MRIYFCDLCNESVPQSDLDRNLAVIRKGRVICSRCERAMSGEHESPGAPGAAAAPGPPATSPASTGSPGSPGSTGPSRSFEPPGGHASPLRGGPPETTSLPAAPSEPARGGGAVPGAPHAAAEAARPRARGGGSGLAVGIATLALLVAVGAAVWLARRADEDRRTVRALRLALFQGLEQADLDLETQLDDRLGPLGEMTQGFGLELEKVLVRLDEWGRHQGESLEGLRGEVARLEERLRAAERAGSELERHELEIAKVADTVAGLHGEVLRLGERFAALRDEPPPAPVAPVVAAPERPAWWPLVGELSSQSSGARWQAVQALGDTRDPAVAEHLAPMLQDPDIFVRMATARILGDLKAVLGIPALIDALEDPEPSVREAAFVSLRSITGRDLRFEPDAKESERSKQVKQWRDWWKRAQADLLPAQTPSD